MADKLELKVVFSAVDKFLRPANAITKAAKEASAALKLNADRAKELNSTIAKIDAFKKVERDAAIAANSVKSTAAKIDELRAEIAKAGAPTEAQARKLAELKAKSEALGMTTDKLKRHEIDLGATLRTAGIDTKSLATAREHLVAASASELMMSRKLQSALDAENKKMQRLKAAQADLARSKELSGKLAGAGAGMMAGGAAMSLPVGLATKAYADFETAMLGVARQVDGARDANGHYTATYFEMGNAIKAMSEQLPMTANEIAAIVEAGARMGIQGKANLLTFTETTAVMASAFDLPVEQIGEDIGKISQLYKVPMKDIKALGDTINFLDDNALAKGGDIIDVMKRIAGTADMVKMSFKDAAALGSTFLSLGAQSEVAASASNAMIRELSIATMQSKRFMGGLAMLKLKAGNVQLGMNKDATGTILKVLDAIKKLPEQKQLEAATRLFGKEYGDDAAKLASNMGEYRRQLALVNDEKAKGSMQRESDTRGNSVNARMAMAKNALTNVTSDLGETLRPALVETLERTLAVVQGVRAWAKENPELAAGLMKVAKYLALGITAIGGFVLAASAVLVPVALLSFQMSMLGLTVGGLAGGALNLLMKGIGGVGSSLLWLGRLAMAHPILALITLIAAGALYVWQHWDTLGPKFFALVNKISSYFGGLKDRALETGRQMIDGMIDGISSRWAALKSTVVGVAEASIGWIKDKLGIHSPSRVFAELGGFTMQGLEQGIAGGEDGPLNAISGMARKLAGIGAGIAIGGSAMAGDLPGHMNPSAGAAAGGSAGGGNTYYITVQAAPGADNQNLAALVAREIERIESKHAARQRSRLRDSE